MSSPSSSEESPADENVVNTTNHEGGTSNGDESTSKSSLEERKAKLDKLRQRMVKRMHASTSRFTLTDGFRFQHKSAQANRASLIEESAKAKITAREAARLERQKKLAETLRLKLDAEERGEDVERAKNWEWTIEENELWEKKKARKARRADFAFHGSSFSLSHGGASLNTRISQTTHMRLVDGTKKTWI
jgi:pre-mRNA-splicing factor SYF2